MFEAKNVADDQGLDSLNAGAPSARVVFHDVQGPGGRGGPAVAYQVPVQASGFALSRGTEPTRVLLGSGPATPVALLPDLRLSLENTSAVLAGGCYGYWLQPDAPLLVFTDFAAALAAAPARFDVIAAGNICLASDGRVAHIDNASPLASRIGSQVAMQAWMKAAVSERGFGVAGRKRQRGADLDPQTPIAETKALLQKRAATVEELPYQGFIQDLADPIKKVSLAWLDPNSLNSDHVREGAFLSRDKNFVYKLFRSKNHDLLRPGYDAIVAAEYGFPRLMIQNDPSLKSNIVEPNSVIKFTDKDEFFAIKFPVAGKDLDTPEVLEAIEGMPTSQMLEMILSIAKALQAMHSYGVAHRDLKPGNIVYDLNTRETRLIDQGVNTMVSGTTRIVGSPDWLAPETARAVKMARATANAMLREAGSNARDGVVPEVPELLDARPGDIYVFGTIILGFVQLRARRSVDDPAAAADDEPLTEVESAYDSPRDMASPRAPEGAADQVPLTPPPKQRLARTVLSPWTPESPVEGTKIEIEPGLVLRDRDEKLLDNLFGENSTLRMTATNPSRRPTIDEVVAALTAIQ